MADPITVQINIARRMCDRARLEVAAILDSGTLRRSLHCFVNASTGDLVEATLSVPQYWAIYYHDGRGEIRAKQGKFLVWFRNVEDDPRIAGGHPVRAAQIRRLQLSSTEFKRLHEAGKLIIAKKSGPTQGKPFFNTLIGLGNRVGDIANEELSAYVRGELGGLLNLKL